MKLVAAGVGTSVFQSWLSARCIILLMARPRAENPQLLLLFFDFEFSIGVNMFFCRYYIKFLQNRFEIPDFSIKKTLCRNFASVVKKTLGRIHPHNAPGFAKGLGRSSAPPRLALGPRFAFPPGQQEAKGWQSLHRRTSIPCRC